MTLEGADMKMIEQAFDSFQEQGVGSQHREFAEKISGMISQFDYFAAAEETGRLLDALNDTHPP
ncbi:MAG: hypothetical protein CMO80_17045 [Verrucomicrobiales bacterium]|nr:hypothetical protein [Verrucomicrobiales bacterium]|tara:strand:- start:4457 stop:4648 length:192 start_codon:yes stop_codon:yes gene_type:complete